MPTSNQAKSTRMEEKIDTWFVTPIFRKLWAILLGTGIILQENLPIAAKVISPFLLPINFTIEGLEKIWDSYRLLRDKDAPQRSARLGTNILQIAALVAAAFVVALSVTNPIVLPIIFMVMNIATLVKNLKLLQHYQVAAAQILPPKISELADLKTKQAAIQRQLFFNSSAILAVGLLLTGAVLTFVFPPAAAMVTFVGFMLFASTILAAVLTSPLFSKKLKPSLVEDTVLEPPSVSNGKQSLNQPRSNHAQRVTLQEPGSSRHAIDAPSLSRHPSQASAVSHASFFQEAAGDLAVYANPVGQLSLSPQ